MKKSSPFAVAFGATFGAAFGATRAAKTDEKQKAETMRATTANDLAILFIYCCLLMVFYCSAFLFPLVMKNNVILPSLYIEACKSLDPIVWNLLYLE